MVGIGNNVLEHFLLITLNYLEYLLILILTEL